MLSYGCRLGEERVPGAELVENPAWLDKTRVSDAVVGAESFAAGFDKSGTAEKR